MRDADKRIAAGLFVLALAVFGWFYGGVGWNQNAHFDLTRAIVERQTLHIDGYHSNTGDISTGADGHIYINKAPGVSFLAAVPYAVVFGIERAMNLPVDHLVDRNTWIVTIATCAVAGALIGPILYVHGRRRLGAGAAASLAAAVAVVFGTIVFPYSTMLFAHVPTALFCLIAFVSLRDRPLIAGMAIGFATLCFYVCALAAAILAVVALLQSRRTAVRFIAGGVPFAIVLGLYQWICFGSPFRTAVEGSTPFTEKGRILGVMAMPTGEALFGITFSPYRGLFVTSPILLLAVIGAVRMAGISRRRELVSIIAICIAFLIAIAGFNGWHGGWAFGPRYLLPIIPLLGIPLLFATSPASIPMRILLTFVMVISIGLNLIATATDAMPDGEIQDPIRSYLLPAFFKGRLPEETATLLRRQSTQIDKVSIPPLATNFGERFFGEGKRTSVMPVALLLAIGIGGLFRLATSVDAQSRHAGPLAREP